ncbi:hypothetical protein KSF_102510 [Reticulibacter mediterranei]|uniref:DDE domain-containing protein n=1 Tax=Reticulibacter mediterranei TaxID=2778369 RepID=A0A8J3ITG5_9CHLR|nr:hypothetical protein KSF_102510 [Reticulibacter mediterranei]
MTGKHGLLRYWLTTYGPNAVDTQKPHGMSMKPTSKCTGSGATSTAPLIRMGTWLIRALREKRDMQAAKSFFKQALATVGHAPERVTTDGHDAYPRVIREILDLLSAQTGRGQESQHGGSPSGTSARSISAPP